MTKSFVSLQRVSIIERVFKNTTKINTNRNGKITEKSLDEEGYRPNAGTTLQRIAKIRQHGTDGTVQQPDGTQYQSHRREGIWRGCHL